MGGAMTDRNAQSGPENAGQQNETPEDVATLYSWANLHGVKYRDFSAARAQTREKARQRIEQTTAEEGKRARQQPGTPPAEATPRPAEPDPVPQGIPQSKQLPAPNSPVQDTVDEAAAQAQAAHAARQAAHAAQAQEAAQQMARLAAQAAAQQGPQSTRPSIADSPAPAYDRRYPAPQPYRRSTDQAPSGPARDEFGATVQNPWAQLDPRERENASRPAWLASEWVESPSQPAIPQTPEDTLQGSRDRLASRWFALKSVFEGVSTPVEEVAATATSRAPVVAVFSLAGGVGKTSIVATLGRALAARGEKVLLVDTASFGLLPFFFGARDQRPGQLRTFSPPSGGGDAPIQLVTIDPDAMGPENRATETLTSEIAKYSRGTNRIIVDLATASGATTRRILKMNPLVVIPVIPDMNSVVSVGSIDSFFERNAGATGNAPMHYYVLNQFDPSLPLHLDVREVLRERLGDRLLAFALRRAPAVSEALAEGMTVMDYAPNSTVAEDFITFAGWVKSQSAPAIGSGFRGVRWSER